jgi:hypothetical protein
VRLSLSGASSFTVSYLAGFASITAFIQAAPLLKIISLNITTHTANAAAIFFVIIF